MKSVWIRMTGIIACWWVFPPMAFPSGLPQLPPFEVRPGYRVEVAADDLGEARFLESDDRGRLYVSQPRKGSILVLEDRDGDGLYETRGVFVDGHPKVHGLCWHDGWMWFSESGAIFKARDTDGDAGADEVVTVVPAGDLPSGGGHWWRSLLVDADGLYTSIGDSGNITDETKTERQKIWFFRHDGSGKRLFASGLRNTEKLRHRPGTMEVWGHDHGSDNFGAQLNEKFPDLSPVTDHTPPEEFNHYQEGKFYGHPFITGAMVPRYEFMKRDNILAIAARTEPPAWTGGAHWAGNGFCFVAEGTRVGEPGDAFIAYHGSWNSSVKVGYRIERVLFDQVTGKPFGSQRIVSTLAADGKTVLARPVDCLQAPDGTLLFSCDFTHRVYRIVPE